MREPSPVWRVEAVGTFAIGLTTTSKDRRTGPRRPSSTLHGQVPFDVANLEVRWTGLPHELVRDSLRRLMEDVVPLLGYDQAGPHG